MRRRITDRRAGAASPAPRASSNREASPALFDLPVVQRASLVDHDLALGGVPADAPWGVYPQEALSEHTRATRQRDRRGVADLVQQVALHDGDDGTHFARRGTPPRIQVGRVETATLDSKALNRSPRGRDDRGLRSRLESTHAHRVTHACLPVRGLLKEPQPPAHDLDVALRSQARLQRRHESELVGGRVMLDFVRRPSHTSSMPSDIAGSRGVTASSAPNPRCPHPVYDTDGQGGGAAQDGYRLSGARCSFRLHPAVTPVRETRSPRHPARSPRAAAPTPRPPRASRGRSRTDRTPP